MERYLQIAYVKEQNSVKSVKENNTEVKNNDMISESIKNIPIKSHGNKENMSVEEGNVKRPENDTVESDKDVDLESVLRDFKIFGRYHFIVLFMALVALSTYCNSWHIMNYVFAVENVAYRCRYSNCDAADVPNLEFSNIDYKCHKYELFDNNGTCTKDNFNIANATNCNEWVYDNPNSFVAEFNLGCEDWKKTLVGSVHSAGCMRGLLLLGPLSDKFGRKTVIIWASTFCVVIGLAKSIVNSYWIYVVLELIEPVFGDCFSATFTIGIEAVTKEHRAIIVVLIAISAALGGMSMALIARLSSTWRVFLICIYAPGLFFILYIFWMDESVRWLLNKGKKNAVDDIIRRAATTNNIVVDENNLSRLKCEDTESTTSLMILIKITLSSKKLFLRVLCCSCMWFTVISNSYTLAVNSVSLPGNKYFNYALTISTGIPASLVVLYFIKKCTRKKPLIFAYILTGMFCISHSMVPKDYTWLSILLFICGKFSTYIVKRIVYIYTSELFPTYTRNTMHALCSCLGRTAGLIAPQTPLLMKFWPGLPTLLLGILSLLTAAVVVLLPETSDDVLPDNVRQAKAVGNKGKEERYSF